MKVATKLYLLIGLLICLATATSFTGLKGMSNAVAGLDTVYKDRVVPMDQIKDIADAYAVQIVDTSHKVRNGSMTPQSGLQHVEAAEKIIAERWAAYLATVLVDDEKHLVVKIEPAMRSADTAVSNLKKLLAANDITGLTVFVSKDMYPTIDPVSDLLSQLIQVQLDVSKQVYDQASRDYISGRNLVYAVLLAGALLGISLGGWIIRSSVTLPLGGEPAEVKAAVECIASGDLTQKIILRSDDASSLLFATKSMQSNLHRMLSALHENTFQTSDLATELATSSSQVNAAIEHQAGSTASIAAAVEQMTVSVSQVSESALETQNISTDTEQQARSGKTLIDALFAEMQQTSNSVSKAEHSIQAMGTCSAKISDIVEVIKSVAEQTNLLALNAAIEAARAGEQGRGFAVVADEVRTLASRTAQATTEITTMINEVQTSAHTAVVQMQEASKRMNNGVDLAEKTHLSVASIEAGTTRVMNVVQALSHALSEQKFANHEIASNVEKIAQMAEENTAASQATSETAQQLQQLATNTRKATSLFRI
jgi:methyl-accepting chemotaxis protein